MSEQLLILDENAWMVVGQAGLKIMSFFWPVFMIFIAGMTWEHHRERQRAVCKDNAPVV